MGKKNYSLNSLELNPIYLFLIQLCACFELYEDPLPLQLEFVGFVFSNHILWELIFISIEGTTIKWGVITQGEEYRCCHFHTRFKELTNKMYNTCNVLCMHMRCLVCATYATFPFKRLMDYGLSRGSKYYLVANWQSTLLAWQGRAHYNIW